MTSHGRHLPCGAPPVTLPVSEGLAPGRAIPAGNTSGCEGGTRHCASSQISTRRCARGRPPAAWPSRWPRPWPAGLEAVALFAPDRRSVRPVLEAARDVDRRTPAMRVLSGAACRIVSPEGDVDLARWAAGARPGPGGGGAAGGPGATALVPPLPARAAPDGDRRGDRGGLPARHRPDRPPGQAGGRPGGAGPRLPGPGRSSGGMCPASPAVGGLPAPGGAAWACGSP